MSASDPVGERASAGSGPVARISHAALRANALGLRGPEAVVDLRMDAWGHGVAEVAETLIGIGMGIGPLVVDAARRDELASRFGTDRVVAEAPDGPSAVDPRTLYGLPGGSGRPVMRLSGRVLSTKRLRAGEGVSYGHTHRAERDTRIALVTGGYAQGVVRALGNRVDASVSGVRHPIVGRVAMDVCVLDVGTALPFCGEEAVFFGDPAEGEPALEAWCEATGLLGAEIVAMVGLRAFREHVA